jgi:hypothetical protein
MVAWGVFDEVAFGAHVFDGFEDFFHVIFALTVGAGADAGTSGVGVGADFGQTFFVVQVFQVFEVRFFPFTQKTTEFCRGVFDASASAGVGFGSGVSVSVFAFQGSVNASVEQVIKMFQSRHGFAIWTTLNANEKQSKSNKLHFGFKLRVSLRLILANFKLKIWV